MFDRIRIVLLSALLLGLTAGVALGDQPSEADVFDPDIGEEPQVLTESEMLAMQAEYFAESLGVSVDTAIAQFEYQEQGSALIDNLVSQIDPDVYAGAAFDFGEGPGELTFWFKGEVPDRARDIVAASGLPRVSLVGGRSHSEKELIGLSRAVFAELRGLGYDQVMTGTDVRSERLRVTVVDTPSNVFTATPQLDELLRSRVPNLQSVPMDVRVRAIGSTLTNPTHGYGGSWVQDDPTRECTSGFVVRRYSDWKEGILTASHCEGINRLEQHNSTMDPDPVTDFSAPWEGEMLVPRPGVAMADIEFHTTTHDDFPLYWVSTSSLWSVGSSASNSDHTVGKRVCSFGRASARLRCGDIFDASFNYTMSWENCGGHSSSDCTVDIHDAVLVDRGCPIGSAESCWAYKGDSGGPWWVGSKAYGIQSADGGFPGIPGSGYGEIYGKIHHAEDYFGVFVQTG
ncbi:MAG: hypothetical protein ACE5F5_04995 [Acidimicrobiia bacterium]